jgi:proteic killer suppression protein
MAIRSFRSLHTQALFETGRSRQFQECAKVALRKLAQLDAAVTLESLQAPPENHLEALVGDRQGRHSIRIGGKWLLCFRWTDQGPEDVEIVDYH